MSALEAARGWLAQDPDPETRDELAALIERAESGDEAAIADLDGRFDGRLQFGTAGLRGALGAGSARMNRVLVSQAAAGFARYLLARGERPRVVIGYDGRKNSDVFARDSAELFAGAGLEAILLPRLLPTPVLAFAVRHLGADAGVMVTASHNPPNDNGYKVYLGGADDGAQIVSPADKEIAAFIDEVAAGSIGDLPRSTEYAIGAESIVEDYVAATAAVAPAPASATGMRWVYTAMHGVGWETARAVVERAGYPLPSTVAEQISPDAAFPTVAFPNPEEPGAMDLSFALAESIDAEFAIANDPDADRVAVAIPTEGGWRRLTGNEIGLLLGERAARAAGGSGSLACSLVSSPGLGEIARIHGLDWHETLTGFKWISRAPGMVFGFEEALGYLVNPETVRDKDGISAAVAILGLAADARAEGKTLADLLDELAEKIGHYASGQVSIRVEDLSIIGSTMARLRAEPPAAFGDVAVSHYDDLLAAPEGQPGGDILRFLLADGGRVIFRPSGTEPKLKAYLDVKPPTPAEAQSRLEALESAVRALLA
ncbi:putative phosphomannomutase [Microbacterium sorbitolivorans]|uniref:Phospho-sugar mutase n=1 Tax=Microbacterium sorbitolivorans TaxID=1867410 RepID=A0A367XWG7_9MICO|nr:phospho-sugar mutase [Microbacterium sorbitolivorans]RCK57151.1 phospho-sugar mutase [Microbacterium sorbitolivorans]GGF46234.1 putative phosphomannomutase [Microbacterium sorbitolivorans]